MTSRYDPLVAYLCAHQGARVVLTFTAIEATIGGPLPLSAHVASEYWSGTAFPHTRALLVLGWRGRIDRHNRRVVFTRLAPVES